MTQVLKAIGCGALSFCSGVGIFLACISAAHAEHTRATNPNALSVEFLGRGLIYSISYDRVLDDHFAAGFGFGSVSVETLAGVDSGRNATLIPVYMNYYFMKEQGALFATGGATLVTNSSDVSGLNASVSGLDFSSRAVLPTFGIGYENRGDAAGFLFRAAAYGVVAEKLTPWFGFSFGYAF